MSKKCCIPNCGLKCDDPGCHQLPFFQIPSDENSRKKWVDSIQNYFNTNVTFKKYTYVCALHFEKTCFTYGFGLGKVLRLKKTACPTIFDEYEIKHELTSECNDNEENIQECIACKNLNWKDNKNGGALHKIQNNYVIKQFWLSQYNIDASQIDYDQDMYLCSVHLYQTERNASQKCTLEQNESQTIPSVKLLPNVPQQKSDDKTLLLIVTDDEEDVAPNTEISKFLINSGCNFSEIKMDQSESRSTVKENVKDNNLMVLEEYRNKIRLAKEQYLNQNIKIRSCKRVIKHLKLKTTELSTKLKNRYKIEDDSSDEIDSFDEDKEEEEEFHNS